MFCFYWIILNELQAEKCREKIEENVFLVKIMITENMKYLKKNN